MRHYDTSLIITLLAVLLTGLFLSPADGLTTLVLIAIEVAFSFDNAIINAKVLARLSPIWQKAFLTVGMVFAIVGMRFVFPILIVMVSAHLPWDTVLQYALHDPQRYAAHLVQAHTAISAFGGSFLLTLALYFLFDDDREQLWLERIERPLQRLGGRFWSPPLVAGVTIALLSLLSSHGAIVLQAGLLGVLSYTVIIGFIAMLGRVTGQGKSGGQFVGWSALLAFSYLQLLDASFSFDGVLGAFAITDKVILIAVGLGVGALWVRSLTLYMVRRGTLDEYIYLEHGAHYAIFCLAAALLVSIFVAIPDAITGLVGLGVICASLQASIQRRRN